MTRSAVTFTVLSGILALGLYGHATYGCGGGGGCSKPEAEFTMHPGTKLHGYICEGTTVEFDGSGSSDADSPITYSWDFGDGGGASGPIVTHTFSTPGVTTVVLTVTDSDASIGCGPNKHDTASTTFKVGCSEGDCDCQCSRPPCPCCEEEYEGGCASPNPIWGVGETPRFVTVTFEDIQKKNKPECDAYPAPPEGSFILHQGANSCEWVLPMHCEEPEYLVGWGMSDYVSSVGICLGDLCFFVDVSDGTCIKEFHENCTGPECEGCYYGGTATVTEAGDAEAYFAQECGYCDDVTIDPISGPDAVCAGWCDAYFWVEIDPSVKTSCLTWCGGEHPPSEEERVDYLTHWHTPGTYTVTVESYGGASKSKDVKVVELISLLPDEGVEVDDGDGDDDTKSFVVCKADSGEVTVTAGFNPALSESDVLYQTCWQITGGEPGDNISRTVPKIWATSWVISADCGDSWKETTIHVIDPDLDISGVAEDDEENPGGFVGVNNDDDNNNGTPDKDDTGTVSGEDDLLAINLSVPHGLFDSAQVKLEAVSGGSKIKVWENSNKGTEIVLPKTWDLPGSENWPMWVYVEGISASASARDVELKLTFIKGAASCSDSVNLTVYKTQLKSIRFASDHGVMNDNDSDWTDSGTTYTEPEFIPDGPDPDTDPEQNNPISHTKDVKLTVELTVEVDPAGFTFDLTGDGPDGYVDFEKTGLSATGVNQVVTISANAKLPDQVAVLAKSINWAIKLTTPDPDIQTNVGTSGPHKIYVTYGQPAGSVVTEQRMSWSCQKANGAASPSAVADGIHNALGGDPPYEPEEKSSPGSGWPLLAGTTYGECDEQAELMKLAVEMLGVSGQLRLVRASTNAGAGNCLDYENRSPACPVHGSEKLLLDFYGGGTFDNMNQFEGCCETAGSYYAVWPKEKETNDYTMLQALGSRGVTQHYCWWNVSINWWQPCNQPDSTPPIP